MPPAKPRLIILLCTLVLLNSGCATVSEPRQQHPHHRGSELRTELLMLNFAEASGWVAFTDSSADADDTEDYRITVQRVSTGEVLFASSIPLPRGLQTHGFEMSRQDPRLREIAATADGGILPPLHRRQRASDDPPAPGGVEESTPLTEETISVLTGVEVLDASAAALTLLLEDPGLLKTGDRIFLRTPPETMTDTETGDTLILSRGRIAGLLEITELEGNRAVATLKSGEIPPEGYLERVDPDL